MKAKSKRAAENPPDSPLRVQRAAGKPRKVAKTTVLLKIDPQLLADAAVIFDKRGTNLETFVRLHLRAMTRYKSILTLKDTMSFGKYYGERVEDVVRTNPAYMVWLLAQEGATKFDTDVLELLEQIAK